MKFKPMLTTNEEPDLSTLNYPYMASYKLDGIRCIFHPELGMISRSLKQIPNKQLQEKFAHVLEFCKNHNIILDGELYSHDLSFQEITRAVMTQDFIDIKTRQKLAKEVECVQEYVVNLLDRIKFYCFDMVALNPFSVRQEFARNLYFDNVRIVAQHFVNSEQEVLDMNNRALDDGFEGLILKHPAGLYKFGRTTAKGATSFKVKPYKDFEAVIKGIVQATKVDPNAEKTINELGRSVTSKKKDDRILIDKACAFLVDYEGMDLKVSIAATDEEKEQIWQNRAMYPGTIVKFKGMLVGAKDLPRHPVAEEWLNHKREV